MQDPATLVFILVAFVVGVFVGQRMRFSGSRSNVSISMSRGSTSLPSNLTATIKSTNLALKCACGTVHKFHKGGGDAQPGSEPYPEGDTYTCPNCGKSLDLKELRKLAASSGASF